MSVEQATLKRSLQLDALSWMVGNWRFDVVTIHPDGREEIWLEDQRYEVAFEREGTWLRSDTIYPTQPLETQLNFLTFDLSEKRWVSISFSNTGYRDIQFSDDTFEDNRLEFFADTCDLSIAPDGCRNAIIRLAKDKFHIVAERYHEGRWQPFSRSIFTRIE